MKRTDLYPYDTGYTPWVVSRFNPRFSWALYVPKTLPDDTPAPLLVLIHGSTRQDTFREGFRDYAERTGTVLLTPLFPINGAEPGDVHGYKRMDGHGLRYDLLLLDMIDEAGSIWNLKTDRFAMHGYSGGGQYVHRFMLLHPERLSAASIGAPGSITLPDPAHSWPSGIQDMEARFGKSFDAAALAKVPVHCVIGADDTQVWEIARTPDDPLYLSGVNDEKTNRRAKLKLLDDAFSGLGCSTRHDAVDGVVHDEHAMFPFVIAWLDEVLPKS
ncbi:MAG: alpha/beta hydrolase [Hyphomicrobiaceae bacterium]|nr:alpha/beta hydrolase [Hyphomicrobiaceae bacterium]